MSALRAATSCFVTTLCGHSPLTHSMAGLSALRSQYNAIAGSLGAPAKYRAFHTSPANDGSVHLELVGNTYHYVVTERGVELRRRSTDDPEDVLYWLVADLAWAMAADYEVTHRKRGEDFRRLLFATQLDILRRVKLEWAKRRQDEQEEILRNHPFVDSSP